MKNLKDEIGGKQNYKRGEPFNGGVVGILLALLNTHSSEDEQSEGVGKLALWEAIEAITSLIEQEKERVELEALDRLCDWYIGQGFGENEVKEFKRRYSQYLAERKEE